MSKSNKLVAVAIAAVISATAAGSVLAQAAKAPAQAATPESVFNGWDKDKNKSLSLEEFRAGWGEIQKRQIVGK